MDDARVPSDAERSTRRVRWMAQAQDGDADAFRALLDDVSTELAAFLRRRLKDPEDRQDAYQETLLAIHRGRKTYDPSRPFEPWLFAIARNVASAFSRARTRREWREPLLATLPDPGEAGPDAARLQMARALRDLPAAQREAFDMIHVEGLTVAEAAARAGTTTGALKVRTHRAVAAIRAALFR